MNQESGLQAATHEELNHHILILTSLFPVGCAVGRQVQWDDSFLELHVLKRDAGTYQYCAIVQSKSVIGEFLYSCLQNKDPTAVTSWIKSWVNPICQSHRHKAAAYILKMIRPLGSADRNCIEMPKKFLSLVCPEFLSRAGFFLSFIPVAYPCIMQ